jgi:hypothetical protein
VLRQRPIFSSKLVMNPKKQILRICTSNSPINSREASNEKQKLHHIPSGSPLQILEPVLNQAKGQEATIGNLILNNQVHKPQPKIIRHSKSGQSLMLFDPGDSTRRAGHETLGTAGHETLGTNETPRDTRAYDLQAVSGRWL